MRIKLVLIVAGDPATGESIARSLQESPGVQIARATSTERAVRLIQSVRPALIVADLPLDSAERFCEEVRAHDGMENVPILCLADAECADRLQRAGASGVVGRPLDVTALRASARRWLEQGSNGRRD